MLSPSRLRDSRAAVGSGLTPYLAVQVPEPALPLAERIVLCSATAAGCELVWLQRVG